MPHFELNKHDRVLAGVCSGAAAQLGVDATVVRLVFAVLALAGGAGIVLYFALWAYGTHRRWVAAVLGVLAIAGLLEALGLSGRGVAGATLVLAGLFAVLRRGGSVRPGGKLPTLAVILLVTGAVILLGHFGSNARPFIGPGAVVGMLLFVVGPWVWRLQEERADRIRLEERAAVAARVHDSVLQTLALVQRHADEPARVGSLARRQERELRRWLYGSGVPDAASLADALADAAADVEAMHNVQIELANSGDAPMEERLEPVVLAAREAMTNAAKFSGVREVSVYAEVNGSIAVFVRDRGAGFDRASVPEDRRGLAESIEGRMRRAGGEAVVTTAPGEGTEVELRLPR
ncbi:MAG TPA: PspC domain-containing protein [Gaiellaceae bacterium]|nr:PspC domain-containing protein [Gaiellaceae bacterium]